MPAKKPIATVHLPSQVSTTTPTTSADTMPVTPIPITPSAPVTTSSPVVVPAAPSVASLPSPAPGFVPSSLVEFRGYHAKPAQVAMVPQLVSELTPPDAFDSALGSFSPPGGPYTQILSLAADWTAARIAVEVYLAFAKTQEGIAWRSALTQTEQIKAVFDVAVVRNATLPEQFPALSRFLGVPSQITQRAHATRKRKKAAAVATSTTATAARTDATPAPTAAPAAPTPVAPTLTNGGSSH